MKVDEIEIRNNMFGRKMLLFITNNTTDIRNGLVDGLGRTLTRYWLDTTMFKEANEYLTCHTMSFGGDHHNRDKFFR